MDFSKRKLLSDRKLLCYISYVKTQTTNTEGTDQILLSTTVTMYLIYIM